MPSKVISFINNKGGVAKTTSAVNMAAQLRIKGKRVLLIDLDIQGDATFMFGLDPDKIKDSHIGHALMKPEKFKDTIFPVDFIKKDGRKKVTKDIDICPSGDGFNDVINYLNNQIGRELKLRLCIESVIDDYDYIILDCPADLGLVSINALVASDFYIVVVDSEPLSMKNITPNIETANQVQTTLNDQLKCLGILLTKYDNRTALHKHIGSEIVNKFGKNVFTNRIPQNIEIPESMNKPLCSHAPKSTGNIAYMKATIELIKRIKQYS